jgi:NAD(P)-dependent dehydrogenase (short-subunit alcohol dehydrogenase family)
MYTIIRQTRNSAASLDGIGLRTALLFLEADVAGLVVVDMSLEALTAAFGGVSENDRKKLELVAADVADEAATKHYVDCAIKRFGKLDVSILNAG